MSNVAGVLTAIGFVITALAGVAATLAQVRKTRAETAVIESARKPEQMPAATGARDSETKLMALLTSQLEGAFKRTDDLSVALEECRSWRSRFYRPEP